MEDNEFVDITDEIPTENNEIINHDEIPLEENSHINEHSNENVDINTEVHHEERKEEITEHKNDVIQDTVEEILQKLEDNNQEIFHNITKESEEDFVELKESFVKEEINIPQQLNDFEVQENNLVNEQVIENNEIERELENNIQSHEEIELNEEKENKDSNGKIERPVWLKDSETIKCMQCNARFTLVLRRHHCRQCGKIFCAKCTRSKKNLVKLGYIGPQRVCDGCIRIQENKETPLKPGFHSADLILCVGVSHLEYTFKVNQFEIRFHRRGQDKIDVTERVIKFDDILTLKVENETDFVLECFPWVKENKIRTHERFRIRTSSIQQRDEWVELIQPFLSSLSFTSLTPRRLLVLINPFGGKKQANNIWAEVQSIFSLVPIQLTILQTERLGHGIEIAENLKIEEFDGIVTVSGDGVVYEVINGLMRRPDWRDAIKIPIGTIPGGSGNALADVLNSSQPLAAAYNICKGKIKAVDLLQVMQKDAPTIYSFLSVNWGFVSDVDFESEAYRFMGGARFTVGAIARIANLRIYRGRLAYLPANLETRLFCDDDPNVHFSSINNNNNNNNNDNNNNENSNRKNEGEKINCSLCVQSNDQKFDGDLQVDGRVFEEDDRWVVEEGNYITIIGCNLAKIAFEMKIAPFAHLSDGAIDLLILRDCSRVDLLSIFLDVENGEFINKSTFNLSPAISYIKVSAFKLLPHKNASIFGYDGERGLNHNEIQVRNLRGLATVMG